MTEDPRQIAYVAHRRQWRQDHPLAQMVDGPPPLRLTPPPGPCERCGGSGEVRFEAADQTFWITCPGCGGRG